jgi:hypothetical protein
MITPCDFCKTPTEWADGVMIKDSLWKYISSKEGHVCENCIEEILGRKIKSEDLKLNKGKKIPMNVEWADRHNIEY